MNFCWECGSTLTIIKDKPYHYTECGLENVYLHGIIQYECSACGETGAEIPRIKELHLMIGKYIVCQEESLTGAEIRFLRKELGLKARDMAEYLSVTPQAYSKWENSHNRISPVYDKQLRLLYVLNAEEKFGRVLHEGIRFLQRLKLSQTASSDSTAEHRLEIAAHEWLMPITEPLFSETCL